MGRKIPTSENPTIHPILSLPLLIACIAATIGIVSSLCGTFSRKNPSPPEKNSDEVVSIPTEAPKTQDKPTVISSAEAEDATNFAEKIQKPLPPPPPYVPPSRASSYHYRSNSNVSLGKLKSTMSMKVQEGINAIRQSSRREDFDLLKKKHYKHEDSIWKKQIILGEKCVVREEEEEDDTTLYDEKGNRISTCHQKVPTSPTLSRQSSELHENAIPSQKEEALKFSS